MRKPRFKTRFASPRVFLQTIVPVFQDNDDYKITQPVGLPDTMKTPKFLPMTSGRAWLAAVVEQGLTEYLTGNDSAHHSPSSSLFLFDQTLSNLCVTPDPSLLDTIHLVDIRDQRKEVKAVIGDLEHTVRATFTRTALNEDAITTDGLPFEKLQVGAIFKILACEIRYSDCFDPARVDIRLTSVAVIHPGLGSGQFACSPKKLETKPSILLKLKEYTLRSADPMDCDSGNDDSITSQDGFMTQVSYQSLKGPSPVKPNPGRMVLNSKQTETALKPAARPVDRLSPDASNEERREALPQRRPSMSVRDVSPSSAQPVTQMQMHAEDRTNASKNKQANTYGMSKLENTHRLSPRLNGKPSTAEGTRTENCDREDKSNYVLETNPEIIKNDASWQPSLVGQQRLEGQVPLQLLERLSRAADVAAEESDQGNSEETSSDDNEVNLPDRGTRTIVAIQSQVVDSGLSLSSLSPSPVASWPESPYRPAQLRSRLPPDSSPLKVAEEASPDATGTCQQRKSGGPSRPLAQAEPEIASSPPIASNISDNEEDTPNRYEAPASVVASATIFQIGSGPDDKPDEDLPSAEVPDADVKEDEEPTAIVNTHLQNSSNELNVRRTTSSLNCILNVQAARTPVVQQRMADMEGNANTQLLAERRMNKFLDRAHPSISQMSQAQSHPLSSHFVPATYLDQSVNGGVPASKPVASMVMTAFNQHPSGFAVEETAVGPQFDVARNKRRRERSLSAMSSKRQKVDAMRGRIVPTARDPDLWPSEIVVRQGRSDFMAAERREKENLARNPKERGLEERARKERTNEGGKQERQERGRERERERHTAELLETRRQERISRTQQAHSVDMLNDAQSVESRERSLSPRSSVLSLSKQHVSTPITRLSDYQFSNLGKDQSDHGPLQHLSVDQALEQDVFETFRSTYPDYKGGRTQFEQACRLLIELGTSGPRPYLRDDFVFRYNNDYMGDYLLRTTRERTLPMPFESFYQRLEQDPSYEPRSVTKVLKPARISSMLNDNSLREDAANIHGQPLNAPYSFEGQPPSTASNMAPRVLPPSARSDAMAVIDTVPPKPSTQSQSINRSQDSSITDWLKKFPPKSPGEASPELGTPPETTKLPAVPRFDLDLDFEITASVPAPAKKSRSRAVPWSSSAAQVVAPSASARKPRDDTERGISKPRSRPPRRHTDFPHPSSRRNEAAIDFAAPFVKPRSNAEMALESKFTRLAEQFRGLDERRGVLKAPRGEGGGYWDLEAVEEDRV